MEVDVVAKGFKLFFGGASPILGAFGVARVPLGGANYEVCNHIFLDEGGGAMRLDLDGEAIPGFEMGAFLVIFILSFRFF